MNPRKITAQAPLQIPDLPIATGQYFLNVVDTDSGFAFRWVSPLDCPIYVRSTTGEKMRLMVQMTSEISEIPKHGKVVLTFEETLSSDDGKKIYSTWNPNEWFPHSETQS